MSLRKILIEFTQQQLQRLQQYGAEIVEWYQTDDYELFLVDDPTMEDITGYNYQIGMQRRGMDFTDFEQLMGKAIPDDVSIQDLREVEKKVREWVKKYEEVGAGSSNKEKAKKYKRIFEYLGFDVEVIRPDHEAIGTVLILRL